MASSTRDFERSRAAGESLASAQFYIVQQNASGDIEIGEGATDLLVGVLQNAPASGEQATYRFLGTSKVVASGAISIGDWVTSDASGKATTTTTDKDVVVGRALQAAAADGDIIEIQLSIFTLSHA